MIIRCFPSDHVLNSKEYVIDKFHFYNHHETYCKDNCDPNDKETKGVNTVISEQINFWISRYKHIVKHMNCDRFYWFIYITFNHLTK